MDWAKIFTIIQISLKFDTDEDYKMRTNIKIFKTCIVIVLTKNFDTFLIRNKGYKYLFDKILAPS